MTSNIFGEHAPLYWAKGLSVIFIKPGTKMTPQTGWTGYCNNLPPIKLQEQWLSTRANYGIGLLTGMVVVSGHRIAGIDVDDDKLVRVVEAILGKTPSAKRGKKGITFFALAESVVKSTALNDAGGVSKIDILINNKLTVLPPSIHPETEKPYEWVGEPLTTCDLSKLPIFSRDKLELLKHVIKSEHTITLLTGETTHDAGLAFTGSLVSHGCTDELITSIITALLPSDYSGNSLSELPGWIASARANGFEKATKGPLDELVATLVAEELKPLIYLAAEGFVQYHDGHWRGISDSTFDRTAKQIVLPFLGPDDLVVPILKNIRKCAMLNLERNGFGDHSSLICLKNGTIDIKTGELLEWSPEHQLRYQLDLEFDPEAKCPLYEEQVLSTLCGDEKAVAVFEEFAGLTLIPDLTFQKALYLVGTGGSGKSTLLKLVECMHSPHAVSVTPLDKIDLERYLTELVRKMVCISFDIQTKRKVFGEAFVRITGEDFVTIRKLYQEVQGRVKPTVRFMGSMNPDMPDFVASPDALERRLIFLQCGQKVANPDRKRFNDLLRERAGILNRWIAALQRLVARGAFDLPEQSTLEVEEYVTTHDPVQIYIQEQLVIDPNGNLPASELLGEYNLWAEITNERKLSANTFGKKLKAAGVKVEFSTREEDGRRITMRVYKVSFRRDARRF